MPECGWRIADSVCVEWSTRSKGLSINDIRSDGGGVLAKKEGVVRELAWIKNCNSVLNADRGVRNKENCADIICRRSPSGGGGVGSKLHFCANKGPFQPHRTLPPRSERACEGRRRRRRGRGKTTQYQSKFMSEGISVHSVCSAKCWLHLVKSGNLELKKFIFYSPHPFSQPDVSHSWCKEEYLWI